MVSITLFLNWLKRGYRIILMRMENVPFEVEFQLLDKAVITEKQQQWKRKFVSMDLMRLIRRALDKLKESGVEFWKDFRCFERSYGLTILSDDEHKHLTLFPIATAPCPANCILFHQKAGLFQVWFSLEHLIQLSEGIKYEIEFFLHKKIPTTIKFSIRSTTFGGDKKPVIRIFQEQEQEEDEPVLPVITDKKIELAMEDMEAMEAMEE